MSIKNKFAVYEFVVDENEPEVKQKKRRIRKIQEKKKSKEEENRIVAKDVATSLQHSKKVPFVRLVEDTKNATPTRKDKSDSKSGLSPMSDDEETGNCHKVKSVSIPGFSPMSDDEEIGNSHKEECVSKPGFTPMSDDEETGITPEELYNKIFFSDSNNHCNNNGIYSFFKECWILDDPEVFEETLISPIKNPEEGVSNQEEIVPTPHRFYQKQDDNCEKKEQIPVAQVIKMLEYGTGNDEHKLEITCRSSSNSVSPMIYEPAAEDNKTNITIKHLPRRSYERPYYLRKKNKTFVEDDSGRESYEDKKKKTILRKKKHGPTKNEQEEMQKWINAFNSHCEEIEKHNLVVE